MAEYIEREEAIKRIQKTYCADCNSYNGVKCRACGTGDAIDMIKDAPAADVEPVRYGRWEGYTRSRYCGLDAHYEPIYRDGIVYYCSNPKCRRKTAIKENYCPNCGTKMDLEE